VGFGDSHRCDPLDPTTGSFCQYYGNGSSPRNTIPDWKPVYYNPNDIPLPSFVPDSVQARADMAAQYTVTNRIDQGVGLILQELEKSGHLNDTLIIYFSDNGIPYPAAKTNVYDPGVSEPLIIVQPQAAGNLPRRCEALVSSLDFMPTLLDWAGVTFPKYTLNGITVQLSGKSLIPFLNNDQLCHDQSNNKPIFASHQTHEVYTYYPMRMMRTSEYKIIHNIYSRVPYPIALDIYTSETFQQILEDLRNGTPTKWYRNYTNYEFREEWELFDLTHDPEELNNLSNLPNYQGILKQLQEQLLDWLNSTNDPWLSLKP